MKKAETFEPLDILIKAESLKTARKCLIVMTTEYENGDISYMMLKREMCVDWDLCDVNAGLYKYATPEQLRKRGWRKAK